MILSKLLAMIGLAAPHMPDESGMHSEIRKAKAAGQQHTHFSDQQKFASLNRIEETIADPRPAEIQADTLKLRARLDAVNDAFQRRRPHK